jgi:spore maturation protein CgeB
LIGFETTGELIEKVRYYLDHPEQAEQIRAAGRARVLQEHTWQQVWPRIFRLVGQSAASFTSPVFSGL